MLPFIIAAATAIMANQKAKRQAAEDLYQQQLERQARRFGGDTSLADVYNSERKINGMSADYGGMLGLVGKLGSLGGDGGGADSNPDDVFGDTSYAHDAGGVQYNAPVELGGSVTDSAPSIDELLKGFKQDDPNNDDDFALLGVRRR